MAVERPDSSPVNAPIPPPPVYQETAVEPEVVPEVVPAPAPAEPQQRLYAGKYATPEELEAAHSELATVLGRQGNELGDTRKQAEFMAQQNAALMAQLQAMTPQQKADIADDKALQEQASQELAQRLEDGEISMAQFAVENARMSAEFGAKIAERIVTAKFQERQVQEDSGRMVNEFHAQNPDFAGLQKSGYLAAAIQKNPMLGDEVTAYYALKYMDAESRAGQINEQAVASAYAKGKEDLQRLAQGVEVTKTVVTTPGAPVRQVNVPNKPLTREETIQSGLRAIQAARAARGGG